MLRSVTLPVIDGLAVFEFGLLSEVFGLDRSVYSDVPAFDFRVCGVEAGRPVSTEVGAQVIPAHGLEAMEQADVIAVPAARVRPADEYPAELLDALRRAADRGAILLSACSGAFVLGAAGLLDGRPCTTHWRYAEELQRRYPEIVVELRADTRALDLSRREADVAVRLVRPKEPALVASRLGSMRFGLFASRAYLERRAPPPRAPSATARVRRVARPTRPPPSTSPAR